MKRNNKNSNYSPQSINYTIESQKISFDFLKSHLWSAADILRGSLDPSEYRQPVMTLLFLKRLNDTFEEKAEKLVKQGKSEKEDRKEDADYFNKYKDILEELYGQEKERKKLGFTNNFEFAVYEELLRIFVNSNDKDEEITNHELCKRITKKISNEIKTETQIIDWKNKKSSEKHISVIIEDILSSDSNINKKLQKEIDNEGLIQRIIELAKINI